MSADKGPAMGTLVNSHSSRQLHNRSLKIIAKSLFKEMKENGYDTRQIVNLSTELLSLVTSELRNGDQDTAANP